MLSQHLSHRALLCLYYQGSSPGINLYHILNLKVTIKWKYSLFYGAFIKITKPCFQRSLACKPNWKALINTAWELLAMFSSGFMEIYTNRNFHFYLFSIWKVSNIIVGHRNIHHHVSTTTTTTKVYQSSHSWKKMGKTFQQL